MSHVTIVVVPVNGIGRKSDVESNQKGEVYCGPRHGRYQQVRSTHGKTGDGFERFRDELRRRVPDLPHEAIYTISAKCVLSMTTPTEIEKMN